MKKTLLVLGLIFSMMAAYVPCTQAIPDALASSAALLPASAAPATMATMAGLAPPAVTINGQTLAFDVSPVLVNSRWLVPMRAIFENLGAQVQWDAATQTAIGSRDDTTIMLQLNKPTALVNNIPVFLDSPATAINGRTLVPLRFVSESLDADVDYNAATNTVVITYAENTGSSELSSATMCESVDSSTWDPVKPGTAFSGNLPQLCAYMLFNQAPQGSVAVNWYRSSGSSRIFVTTDSIAADGASDIFYFTLASSYFQDGNWQCELILNNRLLQTLNFSISGSASTSNPPVVSTSNAHPWSEWGLGHTEEEYVDNDNRSYNWYIDQYDTGQYYFENCGPSVATMACRWSDSSFNRTAQQARDTLKPNGGWWVIDMPGNEADMNDYLEMYGIPYGGRDCSSNTEDMTGKMKQDLRNGRIIILCIDSSYITENYDSGERTGKPYSTSRGSGHFIIVKGFAIVDGQTYFEVYDPANGGKTYSDGTPMCKNRYYSDNDIYDAMTEWWDRYLYVEQIDGSRSTAGDSQGSEYGWPVFSRVFPSSPAWGGW